MIGLRETGKTTFLAALWHVLRNSDNVPGALRLAGVRGDRTYLNDIEQLWLGCRPLERTKVGGEPITIRIQHATTEEATELSIPDMSGELYEDVQWEKRECPRSYSELASSANGALLFLHPYNTNETDSIARINQIMHGVIESPTPPGPVGSQKAIPWHPKHAPAQVKLVELLQFLLLDVQSHLQIAVIVSAWDRITYRVTPEGWLQKQAPLLSQFLTANDDQIEHRVYGVSAQGGPLENADALLTHTDPTRRIRVVGPEGESNDITAPVRWLMTSGR
jgi:hypothetical protein